MDTMAMRGLVEQDGFTAIGDGGCAKIGPNDKALSIYAEVAVWGDGFDESESRGRAEQHKNAVRAFRAKVTSERVRAAKRNGHVAGARPTRARGAGRPKAHATRSSARSGDSGDDSSGESEPPQDGRRECECCGLPLTGKRPQARYLNDAHRKRAQRQRDQLEPDRPAERRLLQLVEERPPAPIRCRCEPKGHLVDEGVCVPCGRPRDGGASVAWRNEAPELKSKQLVVRVPTPRKPREGDRKRRPKREYVDESIVRQVAA